MGINISSGFYIEDAPRWKNPTQEPVIHAISYAQGADVNNEPAQLSFPLSLGATLESSMAFLVATKNHPRMKAKPQVSLIDVTFSITFLRLKTGDWQPSQICGT